MRTRTTAHYAAHDLVVAIIRQDECERKFLAADRADAVDRALRDVAQALGYTVTRTQLEAAE